RATCSSTAWPSRRAAANSFTTDQSWLRAWSMRPFMLPLVSSSRAICTRGAWAAVLIIGGVAQGAFVTAPVDPLASALHAVAATAISVVVFVIAVLLPRGRPRWRPAWETG